MYDHMFSLHNCRYLICLFFLCIGVCVLNLQSYMGGLGLWGDPGADGVTYAGNSLFLITAVLNDA